MGVELSQPMYKPYMWLHGLVLSWKLQKGMIQTQKWFLYGIKNKFLNSIVGVDLAQPHVLTLYVIRWVGLMLLEIDLLTLYFINHICG